MSEAYLTNEAITKYFEGIDPLLRRSAVNTPNRERLLNEEVAEAFFQRVLERAKPYLSDEHFTVDGTLLEAWASHKSFRAKDGGEPPSANGREVDFHGGKRSNETHQSTTDPDARLYKKSKGSEAKMGYMGHALMENRHGLLVDTMVTLADGTAERDAALLMASQISGVKQVTLGDKNYDTQELVRDLREMKVTPHVAQNNTNRRSTIDGRTNQHAGYVISQKTRKRIEESLGWTKTIGMLKKVKLRSLEKVSWLFTFVAAVYNLYRLQRLEAQAT
jgi:Transposase DDE domain